MSNIKKYAVEETSALHLKDANDEPMYAEGADGKPDTSKPMQVILYGPGSKRYAKAQAVNNSKMIDKLKKKGKTDQSAAEKTKESAEFLATCTKSMENIDYDGLTGDALHLAIYEDISIGFVAEQVGKHLNDWSNFSKPSAKA